MLVNFAGTNMNTYRIPLRVVFYKEDERWVAHCLEFDLCGDGESKAEALESLSEAIAIQVQETVESKNFRNLVSPAPSDVQAKFFAGKHTALGEMQMRIQPIAQVEFEGQEYREYSDDNGLVEV